MISILPGYPDDVLAVSASGRVSARDYREVLVPQAMARLERHRSIAVLFVLGEDFERYSLGAGWRDIEFGVSHAREFRRVAVVTDITWIANLMHLLAPLVHAPLRVFPLASLAAAQHWVCVAEHAT
ncbi:MAG: STAS/SEC14 domain-containing protein [Gammaproteobacteria bacterium]|nr:STAS/SEC14 domain-containing protein [Gammaproteobacteria bacterium]MCP5201930.1 STAS/SEC14 domain-containing protein [Gammaproteobacteria bacterium]